MNASAPQGKRKSTRPNLVFITADQLGARFVGCYGSGVNSTPTLDALAADGVRFDRCYATHPVCAPNRSTMLTGRCDEITGIVTNNLYLTDDLPTIAHVLSQNGYRTGGFGKYHQTAMQCPLPKDLSYLGFEENALTEDPRLGPWLDEIREKHPAFFDKALATSWPMPYLSDYGEQHEDLRERWRKDAVTYVNPRRDPAFAMEYEHPLPPELGQTRWITDKALDFMDRHQDEPFFCNISYVDPHDPYDPPAPYSTMFDPEDMPDPIPKDWTDNFLFEEHLVPFHIQKVRENLHEIKRMRALYHGSIRMIDDQIARVVAFLKEKGLYEQTVIVFTTDHGDMMMDHDLMTKGAMHYDTAIRCPLIVGGGIHPSAHVSDRLTCTLDLCPTFCDLTHMMDRPFYEGKSFAQVVDNRLPAETVAEYRAFPDGSYAIGETDQREPAFEVRPDGARITRTVYKSREDWEEVTVQSNRILRSIITREGFRLTLYNNGLPGELFDLNHDPEEQHNLYDDPAYAALKMSLLERHILAFSHHHELPSYRNLICINGQRFTRGLGFNYLPVFTLDKDRLPANRRLDF